MQRKHALVATLVGTVALLAGCNAAPATPLAPPDRMCGTTHPTEPRRAPDSDCVNAQSGVKWYPAEDPNSLDHDDIVAIGEILDDDFGGPEDYDLEDFLSRRSSPRTTTPRPAPTTPKSTTRITTAKATPRPTR